MKKVCFYVDFPETKMFIVDKTLTALVTYIEY